MVVTRCSNNYGRYQFPEKLIPLMVVNALHDKPLPGLRRRRATCATGSTSRTTARRCWLALEQGKAGEVYNIGGGAERKNIELVKTHPRARSKKPETLIQYVQGSPGPRPALRHRPERRSRASSAGRPAHTFEQGLEDTVRWYVDNPTWWERVKSGAYRQYYETQYRGAARRLAS